MSISSAPCRCCRGVLHRLPTSSYRSFASCSATLDDSPVRSLKLPTRDWSVRPSSASTSREGGNPRGSGSGNGSGGARRGQGSNRGGDRDNNGGPSKGNGRRDPNSFTQGLSKWGLPRTANGESDRRGGSGGGGEVGGFGLRSSRDSTGASGKKGILGDLIEKQKPNRRRDEPVKKPLVASSAFGDLLGENSNKKESKTEKEKGTASTIEKDAERVGVEVDTEDGEDRTRHNPRDRRGKAREPPRGSLLARLRDDEEAVLPSRGGKKDRQGQSPISISNTPKTKPKPKIKVIEPKLEKQVFIPRTISTGNLGKIFGVKLFPLQAKMLHMGLSEDHRRADYLLTAEEACDIALEYGFNPIVDDEASFDIYPDPDADGPLQPLRPPVVTIMGHVDHGKTTLLDSLRHTHVAEHEAGGITQHIGAFSVSLPSVNGPASTITFLDTPGHAAFTAMRARGAHVTDLVVLVVAADDGVMPQTKEVLELVKSEGDNVGLVVAINKCDKPGVDVDKVKSALGAEGILLEEDGGDVPSVRVSGLTKMGLDDLAETLSTLAEIRDLRARQGGKVEGAVLESRIDKGRGNVATVLVTKGTLRTGSCIVAGHTWCKVRQMQDDKGKAIREALPGTPVSITGWKELPLAGDELLEAVSGEDEAKKAINNRKRDEERKRMMADVEQINAKRREERMRIEAAEAAENGDNPTITNGDTQTEAKEDFKTLRLVIKADVSGTVEAVVGALEHIGNKEAGVKIIHTGVGEISESDVALADAAEATVIGFSVSASRQIQTLAKSSNVPLHLESVIYRLIDTVRSNVASLLPPKIEYSVKGEATVQQLFEIHLKRKQTVTIAGCRVGNGVITKHEAVRVLRASASEEEQGKREIVYEGNIQTLKHLKKEVGEVRKGMECGIELHGFTDLKEGDEIVSVVKTEVPREL